MVQPATISEKQILEILHWRYATKKFDATRKIPEETFRTIEEAFQLAPSSYGLQPYRAIVVRDSGLRAKLKPAARDQPQITDASHLMVLTSRTRMTTEYVDSYIKRLAEVRGMPVEALKFYRDTMVKDVAEGAGAKEAPVWASRQVYIGLGVVLMTAAMLGIDACPMEGFEPKEFDEILELHKQDLTAVACCALGYRAADDSDAEMKKVRMPEQEIIAQR